MAAVVANLSIQGSVSFLDYTLLKIVKSYISSKYCFFFFQKRELPNLRESTYELTYNAACRQLGGGQVTEAERKLRASEKLCRETLEEDGMAEEDIIDELGIVRYSMFFYIFIKPIK